MLILARKAGQAFRITPAAGLDPAMSVGELFSHGPIEIVVTDIGRSVVKIGIKAHKGLLVLREELEIL